MAGVALTFRFAEPGDVPAIVSLVESAYRGEASRRGWTTEADLLDGHRTDAAAVSAVLSTEGSAILVAEAGGLLAGCCKLERRPRATVSFGLFAVPPDRQGQGRGRAILAEAERLAREDWGARTMVMTVLEPRLDLIAWYERRGFRRTGETRPFPHQNTRPGAPTGPDLRFVVLARPLTAGAGAPELAASGRATAYR